MRSRLERFAIAGTRWRGAVVLLLVCGAGGRADWRTQEVALHLDPAQTTIDFTLPATLHTVHGSFRLKQGDVRLDVGNGKASGEIAVDGLSGESGNRDRDRKMHRNVLESERFPEIKFVPDRIEVISGTTSVALQVRLHGLFRMHGSAHELTIPLEAEMSQGNFKAAGHFSIPYIQWGMKNPSTFLLRVGSSVDIGIETAGTVAAISGR